MMKSLANTRCAALLGTLLALLASSPAHADETPTDTEGKGQWVIPPEREQVLGGILGVGDELTDNCKLGNGDIRYSIIKATYICDGKPFEVEFAHPDQANTAPSATTKNFAITATDKGIPPDLLTSLQTRVRDKEGDFEWQWIAPPKSEVETALPIDGVLLYAAAAAALIGIGVVGFILRKA